MENSEGAKMEVVKIINIFGDFVPINRGIASVADGTAVGKGILSVLEDSDYNIINLECPIVLSKKAKKIVKDGPCLKSDEKTVAFLKHCGFDMVTLANNHLKDFGSEGIRDTINVCRKFGMDFVGVGRNLQEARKAFVTNLEGFRIGFVNVCENESSVATVSDSGANPIDEINNYYDIIQLKEKVDKIILIIHGGSEHYEYPTPRMKKRCHFYADLGVSAIVCHHTHCCSGYEVYHDVPIFYGLGNFFFDRKKTSPLWTTGYFVQFVMSKNTIDFHLFPYIQCKDEANVKLMDEKQMNSFKNNIEEINKTIKDDDELEKKYEEWLNNRYRYYISTTQTWACHYYKAAYRRKLLPAGISKKNAVLLLNYVRCESHFDLLIRALTRFIEDK